MNGKFSNEEAAPSKAYHEPELLAYISHYADYRPLGRRYNVSMGASVVLHAAVLCILLLYPQLLITKRYWGPQPLDERQAGDDKKYDIITYVPASGKPMYAPYRKPEGNLYSQYDALGISKPPKLVKDANRMPYSRGTTNEQMLTDIVTRFEPPPEAAKVDAVTSSPEGKKDAVPPAGEPPGFDSKVDRVPSPTAMIIPPKQKDDAAKAGDPGSKELKPDMQPLTRETEARERLAEDLARQLRLADTGQKIFENEASALRSEGSGFFDTRGFELSGYSQYVVDRIKESWLIPSIVRSESGRTTIIFYIERDGQVSGIRVVLASGNKRLDSAALNSVLVAGPFPPLPRDFTGEHIGAKLVFSYNEVRTP